MITPRNNIRLTVTVDASIPSSTDLGRVEREVRRGIGRATQAGDEQARPVVRAISVSGALS